MAIFIVPILFDLTRILPDITSLIEELQDHPIEDSRKQILNPLISYIQQNILEEDIPELVFICTHNSRRSQLSELWAAVAAHHYKLKVNTHSGGTEVTEIHQNIYNCLDSVGFRIIKEDEKNAVHKIYYSFNDKPKEQYSKLFETVTSDLKKFAAITTCSSAEKNCPIVHGAEERIYIPYDDPGQYDNTDEASKQYLYAMRKIGSELLYVFSQLKLQT